MDNELTQQGRTRPSQAIAIDSDAEPDCFGRTGVDGHLARVMRDGRWPDIVPFANALLRSGTFDELKGEFRRAIAHFGFRGFAYWGASPNTRFSLCGASDLAERFGSYKDDCSGAMEAVFAKFEPALRAHDNNWKKSLRRPALECIDSPVESRPIHRALCQSAVDLDTQPYDDVLIVTTGSAHGSGKQEQHVHLPVLSGVGSADIIAGIALVKIYDCLAGDMSDGKNGAGTDFDAASTSTDLTPREKAVLSRAASGKSHAQIARETGMRRGEVRYCLDCVRDRYGFASTIQAVVKAAKDHGWGAGS